MARNSADDLVFASFKWRNEGEALRMARWHFDDRIDIGHIFFVKFIACSGTGIHDNKLVNNNSMMCNVHRDLFPGGHREVARGKGEISHLDIHYAGWSAGLACSQGKHQKNK